MNSLNHKSTKHIEHTLSYLHGADVVIHATVEDIDHGVIQLVIPAHLHHLQTFMFLRWHMLIYIIQTIKCCSYEAYAHTHLLYVQVGDVHVDQASLHTIHHAVLLEVAEEVSHDRCSQTANPLTQNVGLQTLQKHTPGHWVLHQPRVDLVKQ